MRKIANVLISLVFIGVGILSGCTEQPASENQPPIATCSAMPTSGDAPLTVTFTLNARDPDGSIASWKLDVNSDWTADYSGSGNPPSLKQHTYTTAGVYSVTFSVTDNVGTKSDVGITIIVNTSTA